MTTAIILTLLLLLLVPALTVALGRSTRFTAMLDGILHGKAGAAHHGDATATSRIDRDFKALMQRLQVTTADMPTEEGDDDTGVTFEYQGGHFVAVFRNSASDPFENTMSLSYFNCYSLPAEQVGRAGELANTINNLMLPIKCSYGNNAEEGDVSFSLHATGVRVADNEESANYVKSLLLCFFRVQRLLFERFEQMKSESPSEAEANRLIFGHQLYAVSRMEITEQESPWSEMLFQPSKLTIGEFLFSMFGTPVDADTSLYLNGHLLSDNHTEFADMPLLSHIIEGEGPTAAIVADAATLTIRSRSHRQREILLSLRAEKIDDRLISVRVNAMQSALPVTPFRAPASVETQPQSRSVVLGVPCVTPEAFLAEAKYMADELGLLEKCQSPDAAYNLYWGKLLYTDGRLPEAEHYLLNAYSVMAAPMQHPEQMSADYCETFYDVCYFLGVVNCAMGRFHHAYYYLDLIVNQHRVMWTEQYVCCLMAMHDPRCRTMIAGLLESVRHQRDEAEESDPESAAQVTPFIEFLERQQIVLDIRDGKTDEARQALTTLLTNDPDSSFAMYWLSKL